MIPTREDAEQLFFRYNESSSLHRHAMAVEATMQFFAEEYGENAEKWGIIGFIHDLDWEKWPLEHCRKTEALLREADWPDDWIRAVMSHAWGIFTDVEPIHVMEKILYATDELTGLITATALMRPSKSLMDLETRSVKKKWKVKGFSVGVNREIIDKGAAMLEMERHDLIEKTIMAMRRIAPKLGLG